MEMNLSLRHRNAAHALSMSRRQLVAPADLMPTDSDAGVHPQLLHANICAEVAVARQTLTDYAHDEESEWKNSYKQPGYP